VSQGDEGVAGVVVSTYNLTSTILGAGILSVPYALSHCGIVLGIALLAFTAAAATLSCNLVLSAYLRTGRGSYGDIALHLFGRRASTTVKWIIIVLNVGAASGYMLVVRSLLPPSLCQLLGPGSFFCGGETRDSLVLAGVVYLVIFPLCTLKSLNSLRHTSLLAFVFAVFLTACISVRALQHGEFCEVRLGPSSALGMFKALPVFCFSFVCHLNVLPVYDQLHSRTPTMMRGVFRNAIVFALMLYCFAGSFGYLRFSCGGVPDNILAFGYFDSDDKLIAAARVAEALTCTLALPLIQHPTRVALHSWLFNRAVEEDAEPDATPTVQAPYTRLPAVIEELSLDSGAASDGDANLDALVPELGHDQLQQQQQQQQQQQEQDQHQHQHQRRQLGAGAAAAAAAGGGGGESARRRRGCSRVGLRAAEAFGILTVGFLLALVVPDISTVFGLLGATCCSLVCFILPALFYLRATQGVVDEVAAASLPRGSKQFRSLQRIVRQRRLSRLLIAFGLAIALVGTVAILL